MTLCGQRELPPWAPAVPGPRRGGVAEGRGRGPASPGLSGGVGGAVA